MRARPAQTAHSCVSCAGEPSSPGCMKASVAALTAMEAWSCTHLIGWSTGSGRVILSTAMPEQQQGSHVCWEMADKLGMR